MTRILLIFTKIFLLIVISSSTRREDFVTWSLVNSNLQNCGGYPEGMRTLL